MKGPTVLRLRLREVQLQNMKDIPNSGMVTTMDVGHPVFIHPVDKETVGNRLAYWALAQTYGMKGFGYAPLFINQWRYRRIKSISISIMPNAD